MTHYHLVGIGGTGLSAIARVLFEKGEQVSGSDMLLSPSAQELSDLGIKVTIGHAAANINGADIIIRSSAINDENPEVRAALEKNIPVLKRREFLRQLTGDKKVIAVAGTHGKTTTTAMITWCLSEGGLAPSYVIGSSAKNLRKNASAGTGDYFVIEADEYDNMFLGLSPDILVITIIEHDHPDCFPTREEYLSSFSALTKKLKPNGVIVAYSEDQGVVDLLKRIDTQTKLITYGFGEDCDFRISEIHHNQSGNVTFAVTYSSSNKDEQILENIALSLPGMHNALNATAAFIVSRLVNSDLGTTIQALKSFSGTGRRFDILGTYDGITIIDDYAHHPTEIQATLSAARNRYPNRHIWAVWQPHTYSRTQELFSDFKNSFKDCDHVIVTEIYRSREKEQDYSSALIVNEMEHPDKNFIATLDETTQFLLRNISHGDVLIVLSAGDANLITRTISDFLQKREKKDD